MSHDHERFVNKNRGLARAYEIDSHDRKAESKGFSHQQRQEEASCFNCKLQNRCSEFRNKRSGGSSGAVSFGGAEKFLCGRYVPKPTERKTMDNRQIKSLMKNFKRLR
jgi:hypothetical protein